MDEKGFQYTYSAKEQNEINDIRKKYLPKEEDKMAQLRRLDASVYRKGTVVSLVIGIIGALIMGTGMSLVMTDIGATVGIAQPMIPGIAIGVVGLFMALINYPIYKAILDSRKQKYAGQILKLSENMMKQ